MAVEFDVALIYQALGAIAILIATYIIGQLITRILRTSLRKVKVYQPEIIMVVSVAKYFVYIMGLLVALGYVGIPITSVLVGFVVVILILGFSARNALENIAAWYVLRTWSSFDTGDLVMIEGKIGVVRESDPLRTTIETPHQLRYSIPNIKILHSELYNYSRYSEDFPVVIQLKIPYTENMEEIKLRIINIVSTYPQLSRNKPVKALVETVSENKVLLRVSFLVPEFNQMEGAKDYVLSKMVSLRIGETPVSGEVEMEKVSGDAGVSTVSLGLEEPKCRMCNSTRWEGNLKCKVCGSYYVNGKCHDCDHIRLEKCPMDGGNLEYIPST